MSPTKKMTYQWRLREVMATRGLWKTTDLVPLLAARGIHLSATQIYRLVTHTPERLSLDVLAALCDILKCGPGELIIPEAVARPAARTASGENLGDVVALRATSRPKRARVGPDTR
jgi:DNA-binding Xre family transcriptional regulator